MSYKKILILGVSFILFVLIFIAVVNFYVFSFSQNKIHYFTEEITGYDVGLVLGASVYNKKTPSPILKDRLNLAYDFYYLGKIQKLIVSGDNSSMEYNEPIAMKNYLIELGVDSEDIYLDYAGFDTYDSIYRAKHIFGVEKMIIFTQEFHLKRAIYIANKIGIDGIGIEDDIIISYYGYEIREAISRVKAFFDVEIFKSQSRYGGEKIKIIFDEELNKVKKSLLE